MANDDSHDNVDGNGSNNNLAWFGLNYNGNVLHQGCGEVPKKLLEIVAIWMKLNELSI